MNAPPDDTRIDAVTGGLLRAGVLLSALVLVTGGAVYLARHGAEPLGDQEPDLRAKFQKLDDKYSRPAATARAVARGEARPLIQVGVLLLIATPVLRVLFTAVAFAWRREAAYVAIPLVVLAVLLFGLLTGQVESK